jgi:hypothetical protein
MANKKLQYQETARTLFVAATVATPTALCFSAFSQPAFSTTFPAARQQSVLFEIPLVAPAQVPPWFVFSKFEPPKFSTVVPAHQHQTTFFVVPPAPAPTPGALAFSQFIPLFNRGTAVSLQPQPTARLIATASYDAGTPIFSTFVHVLRPPLPVAVSFQNFVHITPPNPPVQELNDGGYVKKKKRKPTKRELDPYAEEAELKAKRREAVELAVYGPEVEYTLPPMAFPAGPVPPPDLGDLPSIMLNAQQAQKAAQMHKAALEQEDEDEIINILREIL